MRRWTRAVLLISLPVAAILILLIGGGQVRQCLGGTACAALPPVEGPPIIGTTFGLIAALLVLGVTWLALAGSVVLRAWERDRAILRRWSLAASVLATAIGTAAGVLQLYQEQGKRIALETGVGTTLLVASFVAPLVLARVALAKRRAG